MIIVNATAAVIINCRGRKNQDVTRSFATGGAGSGDAAAFDAFFLPVPEPFAMASQIRPESINQSPLKDSA